MTSSGEGNEDGVNLSSTDSAMMFVEAIQCNFPVKSSIDQWQWRIVTQKQ
jgi:hypothetical protein